MKLAVILVFSVLILLLFPIKLKGKIIYNVFRNMGYLSFYFFKLKIFVSKWTLSKFKFVIKDKKGDTAINLFSKQTESFKDVFFTMLIGTLKFRNFRNYANFGFNKDCLISAIGSAGLKIAFSIANSILDFRNHTENLTSQVFANYNSTRFIVCLTASVQFNLLRLIYCFVAAIFVNLKRRTSYGS